MAKSHRVAMRRCGRHEVRRSVHVVPTPQRFLDNVEFFAWVAWIWLLIYVCMDIFRSRDLSGGAKAPVVVFVFFIPVIGLLAYLIVRGGDMHERTLEQRVPRQYRYGDVGSSYAPADRRRRGDAARRRRAVPRISSRVLLTPVTGGRSRRRVEREKAKILS